MVEVIRQKNFSKPYIGKALRIKGKRCKDCHTDTTLEKRMLSSIIISHPPAISPSGFAIARLKLHFCTIMPT
jgi:hypothetical protein